jgi:hypothetical protein
MTAAVVPALGAAVVGCNPQWWQNVINDPSATVTAFEQGVQVALNDAAIAWAVVQPFLPPANLAAITQQYENAVFAVNHALVALNDAVTAAIAAQQPNPDFSALMAAVSDAVAQVLAIIQQYSSNAPIDGGAPPAPTPAGVAAKPTNPALYEAQAQLAKLKSGRYAKH